MASRIVFESDRGGQPQIYVMGAGGGGAQRISYGDGTLFDARLVAQGRPHRLSPASRAGSFQIGTMKPDGSGERILLDRASMHEGPTWAPNGRVIMFFRDPGGDAGPSLWSVDIWGRNEQQLQTECLRFRPELVAAEGVRHLATRLVQFSVASLDAQSKSINAHLRR